MSQFNTPPQGVPVILNRVAKPGVLNYQSTWSAPGGNYQAPIRDASPYRDKEPFFTEYYPAGDIYDPKGVGEVRLYLAPGQKVGKGARRKFKSYRAGLSLPSTFPRSVEIEFARRRSEFSCKPTEFDAASIDWALMRCDQVLLCLDLAPGRATGEAYRTIAPLQVVFRCSEADCQEWQTFLSERLQKRHTLTIVHSAAGRA